MKHPPAYSALNDNVRDRHERVFTAAHIRRTQVAAAGMKLADDMDAWAGWFLLAVEGGREQQVYDAMADQGIAVWLPRMVEEKGHSRRGGRGNHDTNSIRVIVFTGFLLVRIVPSAEAWHGLKSFDHVLGIVAQGCESWDVMSDEQRLRGAMSEAFIQRVHTMELAEVIDFSTKKWMFKVGEVVRINDGPFLGLPGIVSDKKARGNSIWVDVETFGRVTPVSIDVDELEKKV